MMIDSKVSAISIQAILFDLYGTLICLEGESPYEELFREIGMNSAQKRSHIKRALITHEHSSLTDFVEQYALGLDASIASCVRRIETECRIAVLYSDVKNVLESIRIRGIKLGVISNISSPYKRPFYRLGLDHYFDEVFFSCEQGMQKPDSVVYETMLARLDVSSAQVLMVGDSRKNDVETPRSLGIHALHLDRTGTAPDSIATLHEMLHYLS